MSGFLVPELKTALKAVNLACHIGKALQASVVSGKHVVTKADTSPVTLADFAVQTLITMVLRQDLYGGKPRTDGLAPHTDSACCRAGAFWGAFRPFYPAVPAGLHLVAEEDSEWLETAGESKLIDDVSV